jgi:hypothetical protein
MEARAGAGQVRLAAELPGVHDPATPEPAPVIKFDPWGHTLRNPAHRQHTLGHLRGQHGMTDAAAAVGRKAVRSG